MSRARRSGLVLLCFALSGASALIYQMAWTREFAFVFGTSELAVATVLAAYMAGLALGAALAARFALAVRRPLLAYGLLELGIGACALLVPSALRFATPVYVAIFSRAEMPSSIGMASALFYAACAFAVLAVPTALMGATLPLLARDAVRNDVELGARIGRLYAVNTLGAVAGTVGTAYALLPRLGLGGTVGVAVALNALIFALMLWASRGPAPAAPAMPAAGVATYAPDGRAILPLMLASGFFSFTYEVLWTRLLEHVLGASVYAFATMLASFLIGIALGSAVAARWARDREHAVRGFALAQLGTALLSLAAFAAADHLPTVARALRGRNGIGDPVVAGLTLLPSTLCIGATFPFAVRILARDTRDAGPASARVYAWNTLGAVAGALAAGFFLISSLGLEGTLSIAVLGNAALALGATLLPGTRRWRLATAAGLALLAAAVVRPGPPWQLLRTSALGLAVEPGEVVYYGAGRSATVLLLRQGGWWRLTTNGLPEAATPAPGQPTVLSRTARWLTALPVLARPHARSMLVVGLGGGVALEDVARSVRSIEVAELEPDVVAANRAINAARARDPLADRRLRLLANDARGALLLARGRFDAVVSQPSHPWTPGASHLYTREFFELVRRRLTDDGVLLQWIGPAFVDEALLKILVATLSDVFPHVRVYQPDESGGIMLLASRAPLDVERSAAEAIAGSPDTFAALGLYAPEDVAAALRLDEAAAHRFASGAPLNTDHRNYLQMRPPTGPSHILRLDELLVERGLTPALPDGLDAALLLRRELALSFNRSAKQRVDASPEGYARDLGRGLVAESADQLASALDAFRRALGREPGSAEARAGVIRVLGARAAESGALPLAPIRPEEITVRAGLAASGPGRGATLRALDGELAAVSVADPLFAPAARLRADWRIDSGEPARGREAVEILDILGTVVGIEPADLLARARAGSVAGDPAVVLASVERWIGQSPPQPLAALRRTEALEMIATLEVPKAWQPWRDGLAQQLQRSAHAGVGN